MRIRTARARWWVAAAWRSRLFEADEWRFDQWQRAGAVQTIKTGHQRIIYRVDLPERSLFVKQYRGGLLRTWWNRIWRRDPSEREWRLACELQRRGVPTVTPLAWGESRTQPFDYQQYFVSEALPRAVSLLDYLHNHLDLLSPTERVRVRRRLLADLAQRLAHAHRAGVAHNDLHLGNLLLALAEDDAPACDPAGRTDFRFIDLPGTRIGSPLSWRQSRRNLRMLVSAARDLTSRHDQACFWIAYCRARPDLAIDRRAAADQLQRDAHRWALRIARSRERRALRDNRESYRLRLATGRALALREVSPTDLGQLLADPHAPLVRGLHDPQKLSHASLVVRTSLTAAADSPMVAWTRLNSAGWHKRLLAALRPSRARRRWRRGHALALRGIATARPVVCLEPAGTRWRGESFLATLWLVDALDLHRWCWQLAPHPPAVQHRQLVEAALALGQLLGRLHWWRLAHRDLKGNNLLLRRSCDVLEAYLIDLDSLRERRWFPRRSRAKHLARLVVSLERHPLVSRSHRLRGLHEYLRASGQSAQDWKWWWRQIDREWARRHTRPARADRPQA